MNRRSLLLTSVLLVLSILSLGSHVAARLMSLGDVECWAFCATYTLLLATFIVVYANSTRP